MKLQTKLFIPMLALATVAALGTGNLAPASAQQNPESQQVAPRGSAPQPPKNTLAGQVDRALSSMPRYTIFDNIAYKVRGGKVVLSGQVAQPIVKSDAEDAVKSIKGVTLVVDKIQVLPLSPFDDQTRQAEYHAIYDFPSLSHYGLGSYHAIRIIVDNGHVTLYGTVDSKSDADTANIRANSVPNVFSVTNNLTVQAS